MKGLVAIAEFEVDLAAGGQHGNRGRVRSGSERARRSWFTFVHVAVILHQHFGDVELIERRGVGKRVGEQGGGGFQIVGQGFETEKSAGVAIGHAGDQRCGAFSSEIGDGELGETRGEVGREFFGALPLFELAAFFRVGVAGGGEDVCGLEAARRGQLLIGNEGEEVGAAAGGLEGGFERAADGLRGAGAQLIEHFGRGEWGDFVDENRAEGIVEGEFLTKRLGACLNEFDGFREVLGGDVLMEQWREFGDGILRLMQARVEIGARRNKCRKRVFGHRDTRISDVARARRPILAKRIDVIGIQQARAGFNDSPICIRQPVFRITRFAFGLEEKINDVALLQRAGFRRLSATIFVQATNVVRFRPPSGCR